MLSFFNKIFTNNKKDNKMAYVIEEISDEDYEKYNLDEIKEKTGYYGDDYWAIDRKRGIWLRQHHGLFDRENDGEEIWTIWNIYVKGYLISIKTETIEIKFNHEKKELYKHLRVLEIYCPLIPKFLKPETPKELEDKKEEILKEFKKAYEESCGDPYFGLRRKEKDETCRADLEYNGKII